LLEANQGAAAAPLVMTTNHTDDWQQPEDIQQCLAGKRIAVVGLSSNPARPSYGVARYLMAAGYDVIPVNPSESTILGSPCYPDLESIPGPVDLVDVFRQSDAVLPIAQSAVAVGAKGLWLQLGVFHEEALTLARSAGLACVANLCTKIEHHRLA
jgi:predicted CoA-binding protein